MSLPGLEQFPPFIWLGFPVALAFYLSRLWSKPNVSLGFVINSELYGALFLAPLMALIASRLLFPGDLSLLSFCSSYGLTIVFTMTFFAIALMRGRHRLRIYGNPPILLLLLLNILLCALDYLNSYSGYFSCDGDRCRRYAAVFGYPDQANFISFASLMAVSALLTLVLTKIRPNA